MNALEPRRVAHNPARWPEALWLLCHFAAIALICTLRFAVNFDYLLMGIDGAIGTLGQYPGVLFTDPRSVVNISPYFGFGSIFAGPSPFIDPFGLLMEATGSVVAAYVVLALILFSSVYALARSLGTGRGIAAAAAWLLLIVLMPVWRREAILADIFTLLHPSSTYVIALFCFVVCLFLLAGTRRPRANAAIAAGTT